MQSNAHHPLPTPPSVFSSQRFLFPTGKRGPPKKVGFPSFLLSTLSPSTFALLSLILLLLLTGQCPNPGPRWPCGVCARAISRSTGSIQCTLCLLWVHPRCSGLPLNRKGRLLIKVSPPHWACPSCDWGPDSKPQGGLIPLSL